MKKHSYLLTNLLSIFLIGLFALTLTGCQQSAPQEELSSEKSILSYSVLIDNTVYNGFINNSTREILISDVPYNCDVTNLKPSFTISQKATIDIDGVSQSSGISYADLSSPLIYTVTAENKSKAQWTVKLEKTQPLQYSVTYHLNSPTTEDTIISSTTVIEGTNITLPGMTTTISGYSFKGWATTLPSTSYLTVGSNYTVNQNTDFYAVWENTTVRYTVSYYFEGFDGEYESNPRTKSYVNGTAGQPAEYDASEYEDFTVDEQMTETATINADGSTELKVYLKRKTASFKINFYYEKLDGTYSETPDETLPSSAKIGTNVAVQFSEDCTTTQICYSGNPNSPESLIIPEGYAGVEPIDSATIAADGTTVLKVYYGRITASYTVYYYMEDTNGLYPQTASYSETLTGKTGDKVTYSLIQSGFEIDEQSTDLNTTIASDESTIFNVYLKRKTVAYTIKYNKQNSIGETISTESIISSGKVGATVEFDENKYEGYILDPDQPCNQAANSIQIAASGTTEVYLIFIPAPITIVIDAYTADLQGNFPTTTETISTYNTTYSEDLEIAAPQRPGFTAVTPTTISLGDAQKSEYSYTYTVTFWYTRNTVEYTVKHLIQNTDNDYYTVDKTETKQGLFGSPLEYQAQDYGNYINLESVTYSTEDKNIGIGSTVSVYYNRSSVTFTYKWKDDITEDTIRTYRYGQTVTNITVPSRELYKFDGWNQEIPQTATDNKTFEAQWTFLAGTSDEGAQQFIYNLPDTFYVKDPLHKKVFLSVYATSSGNTSYYLFQSSDKKNWTYKTNGQTSGGGNGEAFSVAINIPDAESDCYYLIKLIDNYNSKKAAYSNICRVTTKSEETENIGKLYYSDGTISDEYDEDKTVIGIVSNLYEDGSPKTLIPTSINMQTRQFSSAKGSSTSYSVGSFEDWNLPDSIEMQSILFNTKSINEGLSKVSQTSRIKTEQENAGDAYWITDTAMLDTNVTLDMYIGYGDNTYYSMGTRATDTSYLNRYFVPVTILEDE